LWGKEADIVSTYRCISLTPLVVLGPLQCEDSILLKVGTLVTALCPTFSIGFVCATALERLFVAVVVSKTVVGTTVETVIDIIKSVVESETSIEVDNKVEV
jgi:hypothetical protein